MKLRIITDPGLPTERIEKNLERIRTDISAQIQQTVELDHRIAMVPIGVEGDVDFPALENSLEDLADADLSVAVTEMPLVANDSLVVARFDTSERISVISAPALGTRTFRQQLVNLVAQLFATKDSHQQVALSPKGKKSVSLLRVVCGMARENKPLSSLHKLSGALAGAATAGAFGIFYNSIWQMAQALSLFRLSAITATAILLMVFWLIFSHRLWSSTDSLTPKILTLTYHLSATASLVLTVVVLYALIFAGIFLGAVLIISPEFMQQTLGTEVNVSHYLRITWLSASMGVIAGSIGSGFDNTADLKWMTQSGNFRRRQNKDDESGS